MKKIIYLIIITAFFACTSQSENEELTESDVLTEFTNTRINNFEESLINSLSTNTDIEKFQISLKENLKQKDESLVLDLEQKMNKYKRAKSTYSPEEDSIIIEKLDELRNNVISFTPDDNDDDETIKRKFLSNLNIEKISFIASVKSK
ncbi:MAG: hypothetical protein PHH37_12825 [Paludibacter sp.]|nr:hypothetical protein [Paludibacter sp.]